MITHGTVSEYTNYACRCIDCKTAMVRYQREYRQRPDARVKRTVQLKAWRAAKAATP